jgi:release factor H-coupled RctB family protein
MGISPSGSGHAPIRIFASSKSWVEGKSLLQVEEVAALPGVTAVAAMPDLHPGKFGPVGCAILANRLYPQLVGSDIGCGMGLFQLDLPLRKLRIDKLADRMGSLGEPWTGDVAAIMADAELAPSAFDAALGTIGGGNHFCEVQAIAEVVDQTVANDAGLDPAKAFVLVHSGSRGLGSNILEQFLAQGRSDLSIDEEAGRNYVVSHDYAVQWARLNRHVIASRAAEAARADCIRIADLSHNLLEPDASAGPARLLHRKGAAPANRGLVPIPGSRGTLSFLVQPVADFPAEALSSVAHGAGRKYDRASMHGRVRSKKSDLARLQRNPFGGIVLCGDRGLLVEEAPDAYKAIEQVIADLVAFGLIRVVATFKPLVTFKTMGGKPDARSHAERRATGKRGGER